MSVAIKIRNDRARVFKDGGYTVRVGTTQVFSAGEDGQEPEGPERAAILQATKP